MAALLARKRGLPADDMTVEVLAAAFGAAITVALEAWVRDDGKGDLLALLDRAIDALVAGLREL
jgi:hypothetical protein